MNERVAVVTGGASGLGRAIARRLSEDGLAVVVADIDGDAAEGAAAAMPGARAVVCDVADYGSVIAARDEIGGAVDVLVNNAGFDEPGFFLETDPSSWTRLLAVNLVGVLNCTHAFAAAITERNPGTGGGRIVNVASDAGRVGSLGEAVYSAAKGGVIAFTKSMARELARDRVTVNAVCPGPADTPMTEKLRASTLGGKMMERMLAATPFRRLVDPTEVAAAVAYFVAPEARFTTGQVLSVSGGLTMSG